MPIYEYSCTACEGRFERLSTMAEADRQSCPACGSGDVRRLLSVIGGLAGAQEAPAAPVCGQGACGACS